MPEKLNFDEIKKRNMETLELYVPVVARVHGGSHPEFHEVRKLFDAMKNKLESAGGGKPDLDGEFFRLREVTGNYRVPGDVCESYEAVYKMLKELDEAYHR